MAAHKSYKDRYKTPPVYVVCPVCRWETHRVFRPCEADHFDVCSCHFGLCKRCDGRMMTAVAWRKICNDNIALPKSEGVEFRDIEGAPGYCVGDDGSVMSCRLHSGRCDPTNWRKLKPSAVRGHHVVSIRRDGRRLLQYVHRLVLEAFVGPCPEGGEGCHFPERDPANNRLSNLRWGSRADNARDCVAHGTQPRGELHPCAKLSEDDIRAIREQHAKNPNASEIARRFGVVSTTVDRIVHRRSWTHVD